VDTLVRKPEGLADAIDDDSGERLGHNESGYPAGTFKERPAGSEGARIS
jgi:hypothetical protein